MEAFLIALGVVLIGLSAYFYFGSMPDASFVSGVVGICSFFISYRFRLKARIASPSDPEHNGPAEADD
ncbi:MAG TPA: hypothetical protein PLP07_03220 [Pyrinomonadaceae bacterium]|nr:hypothetical protein [Chloracidobacterium sp.]MBP9935126.1 hypothetical protein [Pyrinomonadaceae bacterium]MBK7803447.1 hypothetical protein [Chloracidobacterium sp.]MBK9438696.1 hypothetical protein [Chloracidobacterium sp.]MBL0241223.1 hypothetical protein [Chloracidobacterium sp.]